MKPPRTETDMLTADAAERILHVLTLIGCILLAHGLDWHWTGALGLWLILVAAISFITTRP